ncbi:hypothetical protein DZB90_27005 [Bacillus thuringiensis]|nr:hypothetical protein DZB90_27005 [Bacillus thuringiensis]
MIAENNRERQRKIIKYNHLVGLTISFWEFCTFRHIFVTITPFYCTLRDICSENLIFMNRG